MSDEKLQSVKELISEFSDLSLNDFRDALHDLVRDKNPAVDRYLVTELKNFRGNRTMRAVLAAAISEREDEGYIEDLGLVIEKETDVGLCKECIAGLSKIGTQEAIQKLEFLAKNKPNATISSLLRRELDKMRQEEKEPVTYYLEHLAEGNKKARQCRHAVKVLIKLGDSKVVDNILGAFPKYDDLARAEGAKVISQLGKANHLSSVLDLLDTWSKVYKANEAFIDTAEGFDQEPKDERIGMLIEEAKKLITDEMEPFYTSFMEAVENHNMESAETLEGEILSIDKPVGLEYYLHCLRMIGDSKIAHANKYHEDTIRACKVRHSRLRHLVAELANAIGRIGSQPKVDADARARAADWLAILVTAKDNDVSKMALYGCAYFVQHDDKAVLDATLGTHQIEGMTRLLTALERREHSKFTDFFLAVATKHEILDIQEMAMRSLGSTDEVFDKLKAMLDDEHPETKRMGIRIIGEIHAHDFKDDLVALLEGQGDIMRIEAIKALGKINDPEVLPLIREAMYDAKSPVLIEACLNAMSEIGTQKGIELLKEFAEKSRNAKTSIVAVRLLADSHKSWNKPFPPDLNELLIKNLAVWFEERDKDLRNGSYRIAGGIISFDLELYKKLKEMFKGASSKLRKQQSWDKEEMALVDDSVKQLNRNYFFLQEMMEFHKEVISRCNRHDVESSTTRIGVYEKLITYLEINVKFILSKDNEEKLETVVLKGLELGEESWREQNLLYQIAGFTTSTTLAETLALRVKSVPPQAKANLMDALSSLGMSLADINDLTAIKSILVVEGSGFYRKRVVKSLQAEGFQIRDTGDVETAFTMIKDDAPDLVITEITFKDSNEGVDFAERVVKEFGSKVQFMFSTNNREAGILERARKLNPLEIFHKPYPLKKLEEVIRG